jgi:hypothetical protein
VQEEANGTRLEESYWVLETYYMISAGSSTCLSEYDDLHQPRVECVMTTALSRSAGTELVWRFGELLISWL